MHAYDCVHFGLRLAEVDPFILDPFKHHVAREYKNTASCIDNSQVISDTAPRQMHKLEVTVLKRYLNPSLFSKSPFSSRRVTVEDFQIYPVSIRRYICHTAVVRPCNPSDEY
jgi:hypothetical protein